MGSAVLPLKTSTATGRPSLSVEQPVLDLGHAALACHASSPGLPARSWSLPPTTTTGRSRPGETDWPLRRDGAWRVWSRWRLGVPQPVHGRVDLVGANRAELEVGHQGGVAPPFRRGQLRTGVHDPGEDQRVGDVALFTRRSQQLGQTQRLRHDLDRGQVTVGQRAGEFETRAGDDERLASQRGPQRLEGSRGQRRDIAKRFVADLAPVRESCGATGARPTGGPRRPSFDTCARLGLRVPHLSCLVTQQSYHIPPPMSTIILATLSDPEGAIDAAQRENREDLRP